MKEEIKLGVLLGAGETRRDAVHVAVAPVTATCWLRPGQRVRLVPGTTDRVVWALDPSEEIGIIDPYLPPGSHVRENERCWLFLFPNTITGLRHVWRHPAFDAAHAAAVAKITGGG